jgi:stage III sporulation protein SpoIIIAA
LQKIIADDLDALLDILPPHICQSLGQQRGISELLEVVLDLGRPPKARFPQQEVVLNPQETSEQDIDYVVSHIGSFGDDNRAGSSAPCTASRPSATARGVLSA